MDISKLKEFIQTPVWYDNHSQYIFAKSKDVGDQTIADLRGWGSIQNLFKNKYGGFDLETAGKFQDEFGEWMADTINERLLAVEGKPIQKYLNTGRKDDNGESIYEGSIIIADGHGAEDGTFYCVENYEGSFGSCAYSDFEPLSRYKSIIIKGHCSDYDKEFMMNGRWSGNMGEVWDENKTL